MGRDEITRRVRAELAGRELDAEHANELRLVLEDVQLPSATDTPFRHPYYWAAFMVVGAG